MGISRTRVRQVNINVISNYPFYGILGPVFKGRDRADRPRDKRPRHIPATEVFFMGPNEAND